MASAISFGANNSGLQAGTINGAVNTNFHHHAPPERLETPPNPSIVIPFSRDKDFVGRGTILDLIDEKFTGSGSRTALVGLGGAGKSQLAIEYAYRTRDLSQETWVFWVHASNAARFEQSFRDIANCVKIPGRQNSQSKIFQLVHDWLRDDQQGKWILILDNVDDASFLVQAQSVGRDGQRNENIENSRPLITYLPQCQNGSVLVTSRSRSAALKLVEQRDIIAVEPMGMIDALALFGKKLGQCDDGNNTAELVEALEFMPLAIVQAASYILQRIPRYSLQDYLEDFRKNDRKRTNLLHHNGEQLRRDWEANNSILVTWQISFDYIRKTRSSAADLLSLMSFFDRQGIPEALLRSRNTDRSLEQNPESDDDDDDENNHSSVSTADSDDDKDNSLGSSINDGFEDDILVLRDHSFIYVNADRTTFEMHRLVQLATRKWLEDQKQQEKWKRQFIKNLDAELPTGEYENWVQCQMLFPHAQSAIVHKPEDQNSLVEWASILYKASWYAWEMGNGKDAESLSVRAMKVRKKILGPEHEDTLASMAMVSYIYKLRGRWNAARELFMEVIETSKEKLGMNHSFTLISLAHLASAYRNQGQWDKAEEIFAEVMKINKKKLGLDHPDTLTSMANLASTYRNQERWDAAEELFVEVMETSKRKLGADHPDTLTSIANLASTYRNQERWDAAEELFVEVMKTSKRKLGADHPDTLTSMANLASTYRNQKRWDAAEELFVEVMEISERKFGMSHPNTLINITNLASLYRNKGQWNTAEELEVQVMETRKKKFGVDHPDTLASMANLAYTWKGQDRHKEALKLMEECVVLQSRDLGINHPDTLFSRTNLLAWRTTEPGIDAWANEELNAQ
ncbi:putative tpr domain protein [Botrytis fragariae]|uniref:Putative tpr domain protein n=1 Tax=Botrytis fragariae TaxID=1964551 RepID=A0A8H6EL68_9HELO|nr:putative tpr domain protein [Botrytis fragariae]KAF5876254.1 putative tpr domain protein [Botrytis fragariae]